MKRPKKNDLIISPLIKKDNIMKENRVYVVDWERIKKESDKAWKNGTVEAGKKMFEKLSGDIME